MKSRVRLPTKEEFQCIRESVYADSSSRTGLRWRIRRKRSQVGDPALTTVGTTGYFHGSIGNVYYRAHRVVFFLTKGYWPENDIDHIDGNKQNNAGDNLREIDRSSNNANRDSKGYRWHKKTGCWQARLHRNGKEYAKYCHSEEQAKAAYEEMKSLKYPELEDNFRRSCDRNKT